MAEERVQRRLAAILAADVVGYSRLMGVDETGTRTRFNDQLESVVQPTIEEHRGRLVKTMGDGFLVEFGSVVDAVQCAAEIQNAIASRQSEETQDSKMLFRIGVHLGDVIVEAEDIHGDGVNIAARLEGLADPGGICVSDMVYAGVLNKLTFRFDDLGEKSLKNIDRPLRCYRIHLERDGTKKAPPPLSDKPAVAVLPFENMSGDPEQEYFADGLTEDIITALSLWRCFPVIARNSTFAYKGQSPDIRKVGNELGAGYVIEGSVRKAGSRVRVTAQLINAETGHHVWAERYDRDYEDIFELQDEITLRIAATMEPELEKVEKQRVAVYPPSDLSAWEYCLKGEAHVEEFDESANKDARDMFNRAIELDPQYSRAYTGLAFTYVRDLRIWNPEDRAEWERLFAEKSRQAVALDSADAKARTMLARVYLRAKDFDAAIAEARRAVECNPYDAYPNGILGDLLVYTGHFDEGLPLIERSRKLNPMDPRAHLIDTHIALAHIGLGQYQQAIEHARDAIRRKPDFAEPHVLLASALGYLERSEEATRALEPFGVSALDYIEREPQYAQVTKDCIRGGLRKAGLLEPSPQKDETLSLPDKPSIAVLPFDNMSGDPEQEYFADGIAEDIITALSRFHWFFVIARNSSFTYKGQAVNVTQVAHELGVQYVLEGSVRKVANRVRITAQLIDALSGRHLWAERYDRELDDIFAVQDEITEAISAAVAPSFVSAEEQRADRKPPESFDAWDYALRGNQFLWRLTKEDVAEAKRLFQIAVDLNPKSNVALSGLSLACVWQFLIGWVDNPSEVLETAYEAARQAIAADQQDAWAHAILGFVNIHRRKHDAAISAYRRAIEINPNLAFAEGGLGHAYGWQGNYEEAVLHLDKAARLSPHDPASLFWNLGRAAAAFVAGKYEESADCSKNLTENFPNFAVGWRVLAASCAHVGRIGDARAAVAQLLHLAPHDNIQLAGRAIPASRSEDQERFIDGLRKAGLPE